MKYIIMLLIVIGAAFTDFVTGFVKAYSQKKISSRKMRVGGLNKLCEIIVMSASVGLGIGLEKLGGYYDSPQLTELAGSVTAFGTFFYITLMEIVSVLENFAAVRPEANWLKGLIKHLRFLGGNENEEDEYNDSEEE